MIILLLAITSTLQKWLLLIVKKLMLACVPARLIFITVLKKKILLEQELYLPHKNIPKDQGVCLTFPLPGLWCYCLHLQLLMRGGPFCPPICSHPVQSYLPTVGSEDGTAGVNSEIFSDLSRDLKTKQSKKHRLKCQALFHDFWPLKLGHQMDSYLIL